MKSQPIAILAHWHTGSSLLAKIFNMCGMWMGDGTTDWISNEQYEHLILNGYGADIYHDRRKDEREISLADFRVILMFLFMELRLPIFYKEVVIGY